MFEILVFGRISLKRFPQLKHFFAISMRVLAGPILHWKINLDLIIIFTNDWTETFFGSDQYFKFKFVRKMPEITEIFQRFIRTSLRNKGIDM